MLHALSPFGGRLVKEHAVQRVSHKRAGSSILQLAEGGGPMNMEWQEVVMRLRCTLLAKRNVHIRGPEGIDVQIIPPPILGGL